MSAISDPDRLERLAMYVLGGEVLPQELADALNDAAERIRRQQAEAERLHALRIIDPETGRPMDDARAWQIVAAVFTDPMGLKPEGHPTCEDCALCLLEYLRGIR